MQRHAQDIGHQLAPKRRARSAANEVSLRKPRAPGCQCIAGIAHRISHTFQHGQRHAGAVIGGIDAQEATAHVCVVVRRALSRKVRQEGHAGAGARRDLRKQVGLGLACGAGPPRQASGGIEQHAHLMPARWQGMAEGVHGARRHRRKRGRSGPDHAGRAQRHKTFAGLHSTHRHRAGRVVAGASGDQGRRGHAPTTRERRAQPPGEVAALDETRHVVDGQPAGRQGIAAPAAPADVEPQGARGIGHVLHGLAAQLQAYIGLGQQHLVDALEQRRFVLAYP